MTRLWKGSRCNDHLSLFHRLRRHRKPCTSGGLLQQTEGTKNVSVGPTVEPRGIFRRQNSGLRSVSGCSGKYPRRFTVDIDGTWDGETLTLVEDFVYDDGATEQRIWTLTKTGEDTWTGTAHGVLGTASGIERGDTFNWKYKIDLPIKDGTMRVKFDDWMWLLDDDRLLNRAYVSRYGVRLGEVILFFEKK